MNCLVTGGAGFIGSHVVDRLLESGNKVIVVDNFSTGKEKNLIHHKKNKNLVVYRKDVAENLDSIFRKHKIEIVFHLAALANVQFSIKYPAAAHESNVNGTLNLLDACRRFSVGRFVFSSSSSIYGEQKTLPLAETMRPNPMSPYALHKLIGEQYCRLFYKLYGLQVVCLRYFNVYGERQNPDGDYASLIGKFIDLVKNNKHPKIYGDGRQTRDFVHVSDVVEANMLAAFSKDISCIAESFNIGSGKSISVNEVTAKIINASRKAIKAVHGPAVIEPRNARADISKAGKILRWKGKISLEEGLKRTYQHFSSQ